MADGAVRAFQGVSPSLVHELCHAASISPTDSVHDISADGWSRLYDGWQDWLARLVSGNFAATQDAESGRLSVLGNYSDTVPGGVQVSIANLYSKSQGAEQFVQLRQRLMRVAEQAGKKLGSRIGAFREQLDGSDKADATQKQADMIMANLYRCIPCIESDSLPELFNEAMGVNGATLVHMPRTLTRMP